MRPHESQRTSEDYRFTKQHSFRISFSAWVLILGINGGCRSLENPREIQARNLHCGHYHVPRSLRILQRIVMLEVIPNEIADVLETVSALGELTPRPACHSSRIKKNTSWGVNSPTPRGLRDRDAIKVRVGHYYGIVQQRIELAECLRERPGVLDVLFAYPVYRDVYRVEPVVWINERRPLPRQLAILEGGRTNGAD